MSDIHPHRRYDPLSPAMLSLVRDIAGQCAARGVPFTVCGEMAGDPLEAMALLGCGVRRLSMTPSAVGPVKTMVRGLDSAALSDAINQFLTLPDHSIREPLRSYAIERNIAI